jgi:hypothetical protein
MVVRGRGFIGVSYRGRGGPSGWHDASAVGAAAVGRHDRDGLMLGGGGPIGVGRRPSGVRGRWVQLLWDRPNE